MKPCLDCGRPSRGTRCPEHQAPLTAADNARRAAKRKQQGKTTARVQRAMTAAKARDGRCMMCGTTEHLSAHFIPGGIHTTNVRDYLTLCRRCHGKVDGPRATKANSG